MAVRSRRPGWTPSPTGRLNFNHPLAQGLIGYWDEDGQDLVGGLTLTRNKVQHGRGGFGPGASFITAGAYMSATADSRHTVGAPVTLVAVVTKIATPSFNMNIFGTLPSDGDTPYAGFAIFIDSAGLVYGVSNNADTPVNGAKTGFSVGSHVITATFRPATLAVWLNNTRVSSDAVTVNPSYSEAYSVAAGAATAVYVNRTPNFTFHGGAMYNRILSPNEIATLSADPFCMFQS